MGSDRHREQVMKPRIIVCGLDRTGYKIFSLLKQQGCLVIGIHDKSVHHGDAEIIIGEGLETHRH
jgi:Trk K+ transport system NAD-binding subunit